MLIDEHTGTHLDAPVHFLPHDGTGLDHESTAGRITVDQVTSAHRSRRHLRRHRPDRRPARHLCGCRKLRPYRLTCRFLDSPGSPFRMGAAGSPVMLLRLPYLALTGMVALLRLIPKGATDKDITILALRHQLTVLQRQVGNPASPHPTCVPRRPAPPATPPDVAATPPDRLPRHHPALEPRPASPPRTHVQAKTARGAHPPCAASAPSYYDSLGKTPAGATAGSTANSPPGHHGSALHRVGDPQNPRHPTVASS